MKQLIDDIIEILENAQIAGTLSTKKIFKGLQDAPEQAAYNQFPYVMIDDGGEYTELENPDSTEAQNRYYRVTLEVGTYNMNLEEAMDEVFDVFNEIKTILELPTNRLKDDFIWGVEATPFGWTD